MSGFTPALTPQAVYGGLVYRSLALGGYHACGVTTGGEAYCWGSNYYGQIGGGYYGPAGSSTKGSLRVTPGAVVGGITFSSVTAGRVHTCALTPGGEAYCWGRNTSGELGIGGPASEPDSIGPAGSTVSSRPVAVTGGLRFESLVAGDEHTCGLTAGGAAYCWGSNNGSQLGDGTSSDRFAPVEVAGGISFRSLAAGTRHTCGVTSSGVAYCWGNNIQGQLGDGTRTARSTPVPIGDNLRFQSLAAGDFHTCGITTGGAPYCWGVNESGQLGDRTTTTRLTPVRVR